MQLIVAEKPAVARDLARVLGVRPSGEHCFEGADRVITWCIGHLVELDEPAAYNARWKAWRLDTLPMVPAEFQLRPSRHAAAQLRAVTRLLADRRFRSVINACDAGREGELIFRYLVQFAGRCPPIQRLWISSLTDEAIRRGFAALRPGAQLEPLADAARSRSEADWLVGMNATRAVTARGRAAGDDALYSIGRVQTPTLAMLVRREQAIRAFVPRPYWEVRGTFTTAGGQRFTAGWRHGADSELRRLGSAALAEAIAGRDAAHGAAGDPIGPRVERVRGRIVREPPPLLFDLTALQRTANRRFGLSAARTLEIAQALYERHKVITYPRTDARHLTSDVARELPALFAALAEVPDYSAFAGELIAHPPRPGRRVVDDAKVHDHHAIIPTGKPARLDALDRDERRLFDLIARRFLAAFYPDAEFAVTEAWIRVGAPDARAPAPPLPGEAPGPTRGAPPERDDGGVPVLETLPPAPDRYLARGRVRRVAGWQAVAGIDPGAASRGADRGADRRPGDAERDADAEPAQPLPPLADGQPLDGAFASIAKQTTPPRRYTEATLLAGMESAGKAIDDEALRLAMKDTGLGTPATRAAIIETLLTRDYVVRARQELAPTPRGIALIDALPVASLASPELTGAWEARLARIARGEESRAAFMADIARYVAEIVDAIRASSPPAAPAEGTAAAPVGRCPRCGAAVTERRRDFACTAGCGFAMPNRVAGRAIGAPLAAVLLERRRSQVLRGFRSKAGKSFSAALVLDDEGAVRFDFPGARPARVADGPDADRAPGATSSAEPAAARSADRRRRQPGDRRPAARRSRTPADRAAAARPPSSS
ncbi:MAG TPA: DNA topoisomerase, partial [Kofleriaceae bacterium]|nr:DNA topoisomerase [Kofleriaceae bacterium]